jgi:hypothetical protein
MSTPEPSPTWLNSWRKPVEEFNLSTERAHAQVSPHWWEKNANVVFLVQHLAESGFSASEVALAVEKPWKYTDEYREALQAHIEEMKADGVWLPDQIQPFQAELDTLPAEED